MLLIEIFDKVDSLGIKPLFSLQAKRRIRFTNRILLIAMVFALIFTGINFATHVPRWITLSNAGFAMVYLGLFFLNVLGPRMLAKTLGLLVLNFHVFLFQLLTGPGFGNSLFIVVPVALPFFLYAYHERWWIALPITITCILSVLCLYAYMVHLSPMSPELSEPLNQVIGAVLGLSAVLLTVMIFYNLYSRDERELEGERAKSEKLLLNILPPAIAERLKKGEEPIADRFENVSVLFADICQFTKMSSRLEPEKVVVMLNDVFSSFDHWCVEFGLEKIKTIGDSYMAVGGLTHGNGPQVGNTLRFAQKILTVLTHHPELKEKGLSIRVGIHIGPVVAGVIGKNKFIYDLWGDTVNTASRMESLGIDNRIHVTEQVMECGKTQFSFSSRGKIEVKGKGEMTTYLLEKELF